MREISKACSRSVPLPQSARGAVQSTPRAGGKPSYSNTGWTVTSLEVELPLEHEALHTTQQSIHQIASEDKAIALARGVSGRFAWHKNGQRGINWLLDFEKRTRVDRKE